MRASSFPEGASYPSATYAALKSGSRELLEEVRRLAKRALVSETQVTQTGGPFGERISGVRKAAKAWGYHRFTPYAETAAPDLVCRKMLICTRNLPIS